MIVRRTTYPVCTKVLAVPDAGKIPDANAHAPMP